MKRYTFAVAAIVAGGVLWWALAYAGLESLTGGSVYIDDLVETNPIAGDPLSEADDHIRGVKNVLKNSFPGVTGAVTSTHTELNLLDGVTSTTAELNLLDGVTSTTAELNILDGVTATAAEINQLDDLDPTLNGLTVDDDSTTVDVTDQASYVDFDWTPASDDSTGDRSGLRVDSDMAGTNAGSTLWGIDVNLTNTSTDVSGLSAGYGVESTVELNATGGLMTGGRAFRASVLETDGTITSGTGLHIIKVQGTSAYGIQIGSSGIDATTNGWTIHSSDADPAYLEGSLGLGDSTPSYKLDVNGTLRAVGAATFDSTVAADTSVTVAATDNTLFRAIASGTDSAAIVRVENDEAIWDMKVEGSTTNSFIVRESGVGDWFTINTGGNVGIGDNTPSGKLDVNGSIYQRGVEHSADYVFESGYDLPTLDEQIAYFTEKKHLPAIGITQVDEEGREFIEIGQRSRGLLEELEKANLYIAELHERLTRVETLASYGCQNR